MTRDLEEAASARGRVVACTIVARNYLPQARVLCESFLRFHPRGELFVLLIDDWGHEQEQGAEPFTLLHLDALGIQTNTLHAMAAIYDVYEFATSVKAALLSHLLDRCAAPVLYLDPDIEVFAALDELAGLAAQHAIVLTPHVLDPMPRDGATFHEQAILRAGIYNLGFLAVGDGARPFLEFWSERLRQDAIVAQDQGYFTDQRWADFVPALFPHHILRDPTVNVAYWNVYQRPLKLVAGRHCVGDAPLKFFHYSGFDPASPQVLSKYQGPRPRVSLGDWPLLAGLCSAYADKLAAHRGPGSPPPYGLSRLPNGFRLTPLVRRFYRRAWIAAEQGGAPIPERVFTDEGADAFVAWLREQVAGTAAAPISRFLFALYEERPELRAAFPDLAGADAARFRAWASQDASVAASDRDARLDEPPAGAAPSLALDGQRSAEDELARADQLDRDLRQARDQWARAVEDQLRQREAADAARRAALAEGEARAAVEAALHRTAARVAELEGALAARESVLAARESALAALESTLAATAAARDQAAAALSLANQRNADLGALLDSTLAEAQGSIAFALVRRFRGLKDNLLVPHDTGRRKAYDRGLRWLKSRLGVQR